jgi:hypothetical protein|tara:strand:- start:1156 stop:2433 length:1278 start_codon:yes stop_codon:yes gene_type:complete
MYSPRSESNLGWSKDEDYRHGYGDPEQMEIARDKKQAEQEQTTITDDLPHLQISIPKPEPPMMPPMMPMEEEEEGMTPSVENPMGADLSAMTGMPDTGNLSIGNAIGTMPQPGGMLATGEPMDSAWSSLLKIEPVGTKYSCGRCYSTYDTVEEAKECCMFADSLRQEREHLESMGIETGEPMKGAWSSLMKARLDKVKGAKDKSWKQPQYETQPGGSDITTGTSRRAKLQSRFLQPHKKRGIDQAPLSVHRTHLGVETKQPLRMFPEKYGHQMATQARRKLMGNIPQVPAGHGVGAERSYSPKAPKSAPSGGLPLTEPRTPMERGKSFAKSVREDVEEVKKKMDYLHFAQIRRLLRRLKDATERQERRLKSKDQSGPGNNREAGHREAQNSTTRPEGATEDMENDPKSWGAPSTMFAARGSGRVG